MADPGILVRVGVKSFLSWGPGGEALVGGPRGRSPPAENDFKRFCDPFDELS